jgi:hypothetical protein
MISVMQNALEKNLSEVNRKRAYVFLVKMPVLRTFIKRYVESVSPVCILS